MVLPEAAPAQLAELVRWMQTHFDELDYVQFLCALEELADGAEFVLNTGPSAAISEPAHAGALRS